MQVGCTAMLLMLVGLAPLLLRLRLRLCRTWLPFRASRPHLQLPLCNRGNGQHGGMVQWVLVTLVNRLCHHTVASGVDDHAGIAAASLPHPCLALLLLLLPLLRILLLRLARQLPGALHVCTHCLHIIRRRRRDVGMRARVWRTPGDGPKPSPLDCLLTCARRMSWHLQVAGFKEREQA